MGSNFEYLERDIGVVGEKFMKNLIKKTQKKTKKVIYTDEPIGPIEIVDNFLPSPEELVRRDDTIKVTLALSKSSVDFFKFEAKKHGGHYQAMIRNLLNYYADNHHLSETHDDESDQSL